ncbi:tetratricopeptide repeat protein [Ferruginibacter lapsinanis]|uniref:tetratricopeptide repeat protein n=1 Tax=Ferruginibacter lapsinanis TaxID=563172 RepID=UPI001E3687B8|nr:tetratricopeptide repeat protein [Ferruginibacter lapsinanis]UEG48612.1 tetratricopeptide repeat protein [Ferruginibacter lapsinanis]
MIYSLKQKYTFLFLLILFSLPVFSQPTHAIIDEERNYKEAKELFVKKQYALAYPLLKQLHDQQPDGQQSNNYYLHEDVNYYYTVCGLKLQLPIAVEEAKNYISKVNNEPRVELMSYHLGKYYFIKDDFENAITNYERAGIDNLSNEEIGDAKFEMAYSYFNLKRFDDAQPLFDEIRQLEGSKYYMSANYYYGFISYYKRQYSEALKSFKLVESQDEYKAVVPYYIAEIYYFQKKKDEALKYGESVLNRGGLYYEKEMKQLLGQIYFEKKEFAKALPLLEYYVNNSDKVSKEDLYEVSYCYYVANNLDKAIEGFKQLSSQQDSLGQNSMYLLGDCYLKTNQKENARNAFQYCAYNSSNKKQQEISRFNYAKLSYELGYQDIALSELRKFINDYPNSTYSVEAREILVSLLANTNNFNDALVLYESFDKPTPTMQKAYPRILYGRAVELINDQQIEKADELLNKILQLPASAVTPYANFWKGEIAYRQYKYDDAIKYLSVYLAGNAGMQGEANPTAARYDIGYSYLKKENYKQALVYFEQVARSVSPSSPSIEQDAYLRSADCYFMTKDFVKANGMYGTVINSALSQSDYAMFQQSMIAGIKNSDDKIRILNNLTRAYPKSSLVNDANMEIATTYMVDEKFNNAIPYLNTLLAVPNSNGLQPKVLLNLGLCYYNTNNNKEALNNYQQLIQKYPASPEAEEALDNVKNIYVEDGKPDEYVAFMRKIGKNVSVSEADALTYNAAELKYNNGDCNGAISAFSNYLSQFPNGANALDANYFLGECYLKNKDWNNALRGYNAVSARGLSKYFEKATLAASRINYFEIKDYAAAKKSFELLRSGASNQDNQLEAVRGLVRCYYQLKDYVQANEVAKDLLTRKGISTDDRSIAFLVLGKSQQISSDYAGAINSFKSCAAINKSAWGAEARYEIANTQFILNNYTASEKAAMVVIKETGSYDFWVTRSYILLGDIFMQRKDYFNAKATYQSVAQNSVIAELKTEAQQKFDKAVSEENKVSKISN